MSMGKSHELNWWYVLMFFVGVMGVLGGARVYRKQLEAGHSSERV